MANQNEGKSREEVEEGFLRKVFDLILEEGIHKQLAGDCKVVDFKHPEELIASFDLKLPDDPVTSERLLELCKETFDYSVKTAHLQYYNTFFNGQDAYGLAGAWITDSLNTAQYTFEVAPVFTVMEREVLAKLRGLCEWTSGDGIFCPGGTLGNLFAINLARYQHNPQLRQKGLYGSNPLKIFVSSQCHYSFMKGAMFMGIGAENVVIVPSDDRGKMIPEELEKAICSAKEQDVSSPGTNFRMSARNMVFGCTGKMIPEGLEKAICSAKEQNEIPLLVAATAGSTVLGCFDPLEKVADVCEKHGVWLHADAAWGGSALLSSKYRHLLKGIERVQSVTWCLHKMLGVPYQCSAFLLHGKEHLMKECMSAQAKYLFQQDKFYDVSFDTGDKTLQCGRKVDVFKIWLMWKAKGTNGFMAETDQKFDVSRYLANLIKETEGFELVQDPECTNVCFWYIPKCLRGAEKTDDYSKRLGKVAPTIKEAMTKQGTMLITYQPNGSNVNFFKVGLGNARVTEESVRFILEEIERLGRDIVV